MLQQLQTTQRYDPIIVAAAAVPRMTDESLRLAAVKRYEIFDSPPEADFDRISALAADLFDAPASVIGFVDHDRIWFKSHHGLEAAEVGRAAAGRVPVLRSIELQLQTGTQTGVRSFTSLPTAADGGLRFCIAVPLCTNDGHDVGTLCVIDRAAILFDEQQIRHLKALADIVMDLLERRLSARRALARAVMMASETDHRVMNSLQFVASLLRLQSGIVQTSEASEQLAIAANRVSAVGRVHRHFATDEVAAEVPILAYLRGLCGELSDILGAKIAVGGVETNVPSSRILALGLITHELLTNARKHGAGTIAVAFMPYGAGTYALRVTDEGEGLVPGFTPDRAVGGGLGLKVVTALVSQLKGKLSAQANPAGRGACFTVTFPAA
jgi:two-component sensor histidine kinase